MSSFPTEDVQVTFSAQKGFKPVLSFTVGIIEGVPMEMIPAQAGRVPTAFAVTIEQGTLGRAVEEGATELRLVATLLRGVTEVVAAMTGKVAGSEINWELRPPEP